LLRSMTGYGKHTVSSNVVQLSIEIRSVNSRYLEISFKLPKSLLSFEQEIKQLVKQNVDRGKLAIAVYYEGGDNGLTDVHLDERLLDQYLKVTDAIADKTGIADSLSLDAIVRIPDIVVSSVDKSKEAELKTLLLEGTKAALDDFNSMREDEGRVLQAEMQQRLQNMDANLRIIEERNTGASRAQLKKLHDRLMDNLQLEKIDPDRLEMELAFLSDKVDVTEEIVRLKAHIKAFETTLLKDNTPGKRLNFLNQEMHREANTIGSKTADVTISHLSVTIKEEIEKIREQVQNIE
jgi:uncharacterized protein (TIGR00255 family)